MQSSASHRLRRAIAFAALAWGSGFFALSLFAKAEAELRPRPPLVALALTVGYQVVEWAGDEARAAGVGVGDRLLSVDGRAADRGLAGDSSVELREGVANRYRLSKPDGRVLEVTLAPLPAGQRRPLHGLVVDVGLPAVGLAYLAVGIVVWAMRPGSATTAQARAYTYQGVSSDVKLAGAATTTREKVATVQTSDVLLVGAGTYELQAGPQTHSYTVLTQDVLLGGAATLSFHRSYIVERDAQRLEHHKCHWHEHGDNHRYVLGQRYVSSVD